MPLTQYEIEGCREAFQSFEQDRGCIGVWDLRQVLEAMGQQPSDAELFQMVSEVDDRKSGTMGEPRGQYAQMTNVLDLEVPSSDPLVATLLTRWPWCRLWRLPARD